MKEVILWKGIRHGMGGGICCEYLDSGLRTLVSDEDYDWVMQWKWLPERNENKCGWSAGRTEGPKEARVHISLHQEIAKRMGMALTIGTTADHIDRDSLNNQRENLRPANMSQQAMNRGKKLGGASRFKGVSPICGRYNARITKDGKTFDLGRFASETEAALAYNQKALELFGERAAINQI